MHIKKNIYRRKTKKKTHKIVIYTLLRRTNSNLFFSVVKPNGKSVYHTSAGASGIRGSKRSTPASGETAGKAFGGHINSYSCRINILRIHGKVDRTVRSAVRSMRSATRIPFYSLRYTVPNSHNGVRSRKIRRT